MPALRYLWSRPFLARSVLAAVLEILLGAKDLRIMACFLWPFCNSHQKNIVMHRHLLQSQVTSRQLQFADVSISSRSDRGGSDENIYHVSHKCGGARARKRRYDERVFGSRYVACLQGSAAAGQGSGCRRLHRSLWGRTVVEMES